MLSVLVTAAVLAFFLFWMGASYRRIVRLRVWVTREWKQLDEQVKRRLEMVGQTLDLARNTGLEGAEIDRLVHAHARSTPHRGPADAGHKSAELDRALTDLISLMGQHAATSGALRAIVEDLNQVNQTRVSAATAYNDRAATYNRAIQVVPGNVIAGLGGFHRAEPFHAQ